MKIIFITREGYNLPGARIRCYNFSRELKRYGIDTEVLSLSDSLGAKDGAEESQMGAIDKVKLNYKTFKRLSKDRDAILYIQRFNYHSFAPYLAHLFNKNRIILDLDDWEMRENPRYHLGFYPSSKAHYFTKLIAKRSIFCVAASRFLKDFLSEFNKNVYYIPSGVDSELFRPALNNLNEDKIVFSWIGTFHRKEYIENIKFALDCFSALRRKYHYIYFEIRGEGIYAGSIEKMIRHYGDQNILLREWDKPNNIPAYLGTINIGLLPVAQYTKFNKAKSPTKLFEYMAMAKPVLSSEFGEASEIIRDKENGLLAKTKGEFIQKMQELIEDPGLRKQIGEKARESVESNYSLCVLARFLYEIIRNEYIS